MVRHGLRFDRVRTGSLKVFRTARSMEDAASLAASLGADGLDFRMLDPCGVIRAEPALRAAAASIVGGLHFPGDEVGDAHLCSVEMARLLVARGARLLLDCEVTAILARSGAVRGVALAHGGIDADVIVVAAANGSVTLLRPLGMRLPLAPVKGYTLTLERRREAEWPVIPVIDDDLHVVAVPVGGRLRVGGLAEFCGFDPSIPSGRIEGLVAMLESLFPGVASAADGDARRWAGLRAVSPDGCPLIGETRVGGLYVNSGHGHLGWTMAAGSAELVADRIDGSASAIDPSPYLPARLKL